MKMDANELIKKGYRRVSNKYRVISRIDRDDWIEYMANQHSPWDIEEGYNWISALGMASASDHYRRVYSKDVIEGVPVNVFRKIPSSF